MSEFNYDNLKEFNIENNNITNVNTQLNANINANVRNSIDDEKVEIFYGGNNNNNNVIIQPQPQTQQPQPQTQFYSQTTERQPQQQQTQTQRQGDIMGTLMEHETIVDHSNDNHNFDADSKQTIRANIPPSLNQENNHKTRKNSHNETGSSTPEDDSEHRTLVKMSMP